MIKLSAKRRGDITEMQLCHHFLDEGYEVFKNISSTGPVDFIVLNINTHEITLFDSKTPSIHTRQDGSVKMSCSATTTKQKELGVKVVLMYQDTIYSDEDRVGVQI